MVGLGLNLGLGLGVVDLGIGLGFGLGHSLSLGLVLSCLAFLGPLHCLALPWSCLVSCPVLSHAFSIAYNDTRQEK